MDFARRTVLAWLGGALISGTFSRRGAAQTFPARPTDVLADPAVRNRFDELGLEIFPRDQQTAGKLREMVEADAKKWWPIIRELRIKPE